MTNNEKLLAIRGRLANRAVEQWGWNSKRDFLRHEAYRFRADRKIKELEEKIRELEKKK